jgi:hypothetical protein
MLRVMLQFLNFPRILSTIAPQPLKVKAIRILVVDDEDGVRALLSEVL